MWDYVSVENENPHYGARFYHSNPVDEGFAGFDLEGKSFEEIMTHDDARGRCSLWSNKKTCV